MEFKDAVKSLRSELGLTQVELAMGLNMNAITIGRWESGKTKPTRSITALLLDYARANGASEVCIDRLSRSINAAAKSRLAISEDGTAIGQDTLRQLTDDASYAICVCDVETDEILYLNRKASEMAGADEPAEGAKCYEYLMHRQTPCESCDKAELAEDRFKRCEVCCPASGKTYHVQGKLVQWNGRKAQVRYIFVNGSAEEQQQSENQTDSARLKAIFENINGGVTVAVYEDSGERRLAFVNDQYYRLFGYTKEQFEEELKDPHDTVHPEDWELAAASIRRVRETGQAATFRYRIVKRDKSIAYVRCNSSLTTIDGVSGNVLISVLTDITDAAMIEHQAIVSGQRLDAIMKNINSAVTASIVGSDGTVSFLFSNDLYHEMFGYTKEQYDAEVPDPFILVHPEDVDMVRAAVLRLRRVGDAKELLFRGVTRDGQTKWLRVRISMMTFPDADVPVQLSVFTDVTDIVEAQELLSAQHEQIEGLLNDTPSGIAIIEVDPADIENTLHTTYYNDRFFTFSGYSRQEYHSRLTGNELSLVFVEDVPLLVADTKKICESEIGSSVDSMVRCHTKDGGYRWLLLTGQLVERRGDICVINIALMDITDRQDAVDRQRISDEMLRIAAETDQRAVIVYDVKKDVCRVESRALYSAEYGEVFENPAVSVAERGIVAPESAEECRSLYTRIRNGEQKIRVSLQLCSGPDKYEWFECNATTVLDGEGQPDHAVLVFHNVTERRMKEAVFKKWQQSIVSRPQESYTLFRCNLSRDASLDIRDGKLLSIEFPANVMSFNGRTKVYAEERVHPDDREMYEKLLDSSRLLAMFYRGEHSASIEYREIADNGEVMWRRLTAETVEYPDSRDIQAFLMYEDIDEEKKAEISAREQAESDPLTGLLNRSAFADKVDEILGENRNSHGALIILDMDGFKQLNDTFGHAAGDQALQEVAAVLRSYTRSDDLVCRLGGDEFLVWLRDVPYDAVIGKTVEQMCEHIRKAYSQKVLLSASAGIAVYPRDGGSYDELYPNADKALYKVKQSKKGSYAFYSVLGEEVTEELTQAVSAVRQAPRLPLNAMRRMLIVDDSESSRLLLKSIFKGEYMIETAKNGAEAMIRLRHFGVSISVVLLDLMMPGIDGFAVLRKMQSDLDLRTIPVIIVTGDAEHKTLLKAFELGAAEYIEKPIDMDLIRMRVRAVISKAENERLRAQNSYLMLQRDEEVKYRTVLESTGTVVIEYDWRNHVFIYDGEVSRRIAGTYDHRGLWKIFLSDMVADSADVKQLQDTLITLAGDRGRKKDSRLVKLKTPEGAKHWFRMNIYKSVDDFGLAEKLIITFNDVHEEVLANDRLLFQATRDELTGLLNRSAFLEKATELIASREPGHFIMTCMDVEKFQVINDQYGTERGDEVLRHIAATVDEFTRSCGGLCCRYMADEFAILYPATLQNSAELEEVHSEAAAPDCIPRSLRLRIGRCLISDVSVPVSAVFDRAAMAEDLAKGRYDTYVVYYDESMRESLLQEQEVVGDMLDALQNGEFEPWFQPQYNHATGALIGAEALVRWRRNGKIIPPNLFIPMFEKNGFIYEVDQSVWRQVCALLRRWLDEGRNPLPVSVNISRFDMFQDGFVDVITGLVEEYRLPAELLRLEITESAFSATTSVIKDIAGRLIDAGFTVEIDDFGSGYSSLNTLKDVPATILKLDMRFFETTENSARGGNIVEAIVRMAKWLGMAVIAEGVEYREQADYLKSIGCYYIQGYFYSKPVPVDEYVKKLQEGVHEHKLSHLETLETMDSDLFWDPRSMETLIFNSYVGGACIFEVSGAKPELLRYNDQFISELRGLIPENAEIQDIDIIPFLDEVSRADMDRALLKALDTGREASSEMRLTKGGQTEYVRVTCRVIAKTRDSALYYSVIQNRTEQRVLERERTESAERLSAIMSNVNGGVSASVYHDGRVDMIFANNGFYEMFGYTKEQFEAEVPNTFDLIQIDDRNVILETVERVVNERGTETYEYRCRRRDGSMIWVHTANTVISLAGVGDRVLLAVITDITALRSAEETSRETSDRLEAVMNAMTSGMTAVAFRGKNMQFLFANDRYYQLHGIEKESCAGDEFHNALQLIIPEDRKRVVKLVMQTAEAGRSAATEYRIKRPDGTVRWIKATLNVTALIGVDMPVLVVVFTDITEEKATNDQIRFLNVAAGEILAQPDSNIGIQRTLERLLSYFAGGRTYIFELNDETHTSDNTYEVCAEGVSPELERLQGVPYGTQQYWFDAFKNAGFVIIPDVAAMDEAEAVMRDLLLSQDISSIIVAPLWRDSKLIGYMGVDNPTVALDQVHQLVALTDYIAVLLTRRDLMKTIKQERQTAQQLMDDTPGGFLRMELLEGRNPVIVTVNDGMCKMLGMTRDEVMEAYGDNVYACLAEDDAANAPGEILQSYSCGRQYTSTCKLKKKDGSLFWVMLFGRFLRGEGGKLYLNAYFTDITEQRSMEQLQVDLLDNLPFGAAMYEYDGRTLRAIHLNKRYTQMVNREVDIAADGFSLLDAIYPDDRMTAFEEINAAIAEKRNAACEMRLLCGDGEYRLFHLDARIEPEADGRYVLYVAYDPITDKEQEFRLTSQRLKLLSDSIPGGIATFRCRRGAIEPVYFNDGICRMSGYPREAFESGEVTVLGIIFAEDRPIIHEQFELLIQGRPGLDYTMRVHTNGGGFKWVECAASVTGREADNVFHISAVLTDVTKRQEERERLRVSEELNRLAIDQSGKTIARYDVASRRMTLPYSLPAIYESAKVLENVPEEQIQRGRISPDTADAYSSVFERINSGEASGEASYQQNSKLGWRWLKSRFTTVFASDGSPVSAVVSFEDITEQRDKEAVYSRWQNAMSERSEDSYTIVRCNLNKASMMDSWEGNLLPIRFTDPSQPFNSRTAEYAQRFICEEDRDAFRAFLNSDTMLAEYHRGHRSDSMDYRQISEDGGVRWLRLTVDLVEYQDSTDVEAYLLYEDIDQQKRAEISAIRRAETDPLTGVLNRATFAQRVSEVISSFGPQVRHALFILDVDSFKQINDSFGHGAGDQLLTDISDVLTRLSRKEDLVGRLGGDEFFLFISDIATEKAAAKKAQQICDMTRKALSADIHVSASIGVSLYPKDGEDFDALYKAADEALYRTKNGGKDGYCLSSDDPVLHGGAKWRGNLTAIRPETGERRKTRRILIVDDDSISLSELEAVLKEDYTVEKAADGAAALELLQHYGTAVSAVLLDLMMPGMSGYEVLDRIQRDDRTRTIPVIVVTGDEERETALRVIRAGASDLITKPVDADLLRIRIASAVSKSENERLRAQNSYLAIRNTEVNSYRAALERTGTVVIALDLDREEFSYSPTVAAKLAGKYDERPLWSILLSDKVADRQTVRDMRQLVQDVAGDRERTEGSLRVRLKTAAGAEGVFDLYVFKEPDDYGLASRMVMTIKEAAPE